MTEAASLLFPHAMRCVRLLRYFHNRHGKFSDEPVADSSIEIRGASRRTHTCRISLGIRCNASHASSSSINGC